MKVYIYIHILAGCKNQAGTAYMERHNQVDGMVYRNICTEYGLEQGWAIHFPKGPHEKQGLLWRAGPIG